ncbi:ribonuclease H-like domain-containing protein [Tanacetum coccineum]|uniref:Ribonuclease H-like domain-containing protein n=1 Tax=Tanacetum coccineum TaxID=301880 RepID=A0ABQ4XCB0_9ASTR
MKLMQTQKDHSHPILALNVDSLKVYFVVIQNTRSEKEDSNSETASNKLVKECSLNSETKDVHAILNVDQLQKQLDKDEFQEDESMAAFWVVNNQFQKFINSKFTLDYGQSNEQKSTLLITWTRRFKHFRDTLLKTGCGAREVRFDMRYMHWMIIWLTQKASRTDSTVQDGLAARVRNDTDADVADYSDHFMRRANVLENTTSLPCFNIADIQKDQIQEKVVAIAALKNDSSRNVLRTCQVLVQMTWFHNHYLDAAKKKIQERDRNSTTSVPTSARIQTTTDDRKPNPRSNNQTSRSLHVSKSSRVTITAVPKADHSKSSSSFSDSKNFVCSTCHKCVFNAKSDDLYNKNSCNLFVMSTRKFSDMVAEKDDISGESIVKVDPTDDDTEIWSLFTTVQAFDPQCQDVCQFTRDNDVSVEFDAYGFSVKDYQTRRLLLRCDSTGDLYPVTQQPSSQTLVVFLSFSSTTWHRRLGHPGDDVLRRLESRNLISCRKSKLSALCHACQLGKHAKLLFYNSESSVDSVADINKRYVDNQALQCDHGGEYDNTRFHDLFCQNGIQFWFSCPRTSQQNGKSERMLHTINNLIRALLFQAHLPPSYWVEALNLAAHLLNILPSTAINNEIPFTKH